jgi:hypothetical protein
MLDIDISFGREGRSGARKIRMSTLGREHSGAVGIEEAEGQSHGYRPNFGK